MEEGNEDRDAVTVDTVLTVFQNVTSVFAIMLCITIFIFGCVTLGTCPTQPALPILIILQGPFTIVIPILYLVKYRCGVKIKATSFLTLLITFLVFALGILIACTYLVDGSGCKEKDVYKGGIAFVVILWVATGVAAVTGLLKLVSVLCFEQEEEGYGGSTGLGSGSYTYNNHPPCPPYRHNCPFHHNNELFFISPP